MRSCFQFQVSPLQRDRLKALVTCASSTKGPIATDLSGVCLA